MVFDHQPLLTTRLNMITGNYVASAISALKGGRGEQNLEKQVVNSKGSMSASLDLVSKSLFTTSLIWSADCGRIRVGRGRTK